MTTARPQTSATGTGTGTDPTVDRVEADPDVEVPSSDLLDPEIAALLKRDAHGLVAAVVQDATSGDVLMVGYMNDTALARTLATGRTTFWSRSRAEYWVKGETSGHRQWVREVRLDCDGDALLVRVEQDGPACHTGDRTCFDARLLPGVPGDRAATPVTTPVTTPVPARSGTD